MEWEVTLIEWIQNNFSSMSKILGNVFSFIGGETGLMILIVVVLFCWKKEVGQRLALIVACLLGWLSMIKAAVMRPRPYVQYSDRVEALAIVDKGAAATDIVAQGYSFPSMHSGATAASYFTIANFIKKKSFYIIAIAITFLVGFFRVATGNHYPTDVIVGWALGFVVIGIFELLYKYVKKEWLRHLILLASVLPGLLFVRTNDYYTALGLLIGAIIAIPFEHKYVNYKETKNVFAMILRTVCAFAIYFGLNTLLKLPFSSQFLENGTLIALLIRTIRYSIIMFVIIGVYPLIFPLFEKIGKNK